MKKIFLALCLVGSLFTTSCDMDKSPIGALDDQTAIQSLNDVFRFRNGLYANLRGLTNGSYVYVTDMQADQFQAVMSYGNRNGVIHAGTFTSADGEFEGRWSSCYSVIASCNYLLAEINKLKEAAKFEGEDLVSLNRYEGETKFVRAYTYYWLADRFCEQYNSTIADAAGKGLPLVATYNPTGDLSKYPGRSTQKETYAFIEKDLQDAYDELVAYEKIDSKNIAPDAANLSSYAVLALQARIALNKGEDATAVAKAETVINSGVYSLTAYADFVKMWSEDESTEAIFRPILNNQELSGSIGGAYLSVKRDDAYYIPSTETLGMYPKGDIRFDAYFDIWKLVIEGSEVQAYVFNKYPGNESLKTGSEPNYQNMTKPFRLAELYLIAAEASAKTNPAKANKYLKELRIARIKDYKQDVDYSGMALVEEIRLERQRELLGEGFRLTDLRRWNLGFQRGVKHPENPAIESILAVNGKGLKYEAGDYRLVWPIPSAEIQTNPQMKGQQNPGY